LYFVDNPYDIVTEDPAGGGNDIVVASISYTLPANVEALVLLEGSAAVDGAGNDANNALIGNSGNNSTARAATITWPAASATTSISSTKPATW